MRKITVKRPIERFNRNCSYRIFIDDENEIELKYGEEKTIEVDSKSELLTAKIHWCGSKKIKLTDTVNDTVFEARGNKFLNQRFPILAVVPLFASSFALNSGSEILKNLGMGLLIVLFAFVIAILTIGRKKWLNIKNIS